jgi:hypothetical protein
LTICRLIVILALAFSRMALISILSLRGVEPLLSSFDKRSSDLMFCHRRELRAWSNWKPG